MAKARDLAFSEGETWVINFALRDAAGQPLDLTGALVEWVVESTLPGGASLLVDTEGAFVDISDVENGLGTVSIPPADHASIPAGEYRHELRATLADSIVTVQITGNLSVADSAFGSVAASFPLYRTGGLQLVFDDGTSDADPGNGEFRFNNAASSSATFIYVDLLDRFGVDITDWLEALDDSTTTAARGHLRFSKASNEAIWHEFLITGAVTTATGYRKIPVSYIEGAGTFAAGDIGTVQFSRTGNIGATGATGTDGIDPGILFAFSTTTTDADPGAGILRANNASLASATSLYIDDLDSSANNVEAHLLTWDDSTNTPKGHLYLTRASDGAQTIFTVGAVTDASGYIKLAVTYVSGATSFANADAINAQFYRSGDVGADGDDGDDGNDGANGASALTVVRVVATANVVIASALENGDTVNGVVLATNDLVLLTGQTAPEENGVYVAAASGAAARHTSFDAYDELPGAYFSIMEGTLYADTLWRCTSNKGGTIDVTAVAISQSIQGGWTYDTTITTTGGTVVNIDVAGHNAVRLVLRGVSQSSSGQPTWRVSPDDGTTVRSGASDYFLMFINHAASNDSFGSAVTIGSAAITGNHYGQIEIHGLNVAQRSSYRTTTTSAASSAANVRDGYIDLAEVIQTIVLLCSAGTFDVMAVDVWVQG